MSLFTARLRECVVRAETTSAPVDSDENPASEVGQAERRRAVTSPVSLADRLEQQRILDPADLASVGHEPAVGRGRAAVAGDRACGNLEALRDATNLRECESAPAGR